MTVQGELLAFFGQEILAHAATLVATIAAAFVFMSSFRWREKWRGRKRSYAGRVIHFLTSGGLLSVAVYVLFRMMWYGQLVFIAMMGVAQCDDTLLNQYFLCVCKYAVVTLSDRGWWFWLIAQFGLSYMNNPLVLAFSVLLGFLFAGLVSYLFDVSPTTH